MSIHNFGNSHVICLFQGFVLKDRTSLTENSYDLICKPDNTLNRVTNCERKCQLISFQKLIFYREKW